MDNGHDNESVYYQQQQHNGNNYHHQHHHQSMTSVSDVHHSRNSINHQDVIVARESPYSKDMADMGEENGLGHAHTVNGTSSKYSLLQFAAQHFRTE